MCVCACMSVRTVRGLYFCVCLRVSVRMCPGSAGIECCVRGTGSVGSVEPAWSAESADRMGGADRTGSAENRGECRNCWGVRELLGERTLLKVQRGRGAQGAWSGAAEHVGCVHEMECVLIFPKTFVFPCVSGGRGACGSGECGACLCAYVCVKMIGISN